MKIIACTEPARIGLATRRVHQRLLDAALKESDAATLCKIATAMVTTGDVLLRLARVPKSGTIQEGEPKPALAVEAVIKDAEEVLSNTTG